MKVGTILGTARVLLPGLAMPKTQLPHSQLQEEVLVRKLGVVVSSLPASFDLSTRAL